MAGPRRTTLTKKKKPIVRVSQKQKEHFKELKKSSREPIWTDVPATQSQIADAFNYYRLEFGPADAKKFIATYLKNTNRLKELSRLRDVPDKWINQTAGWIARCINNGAKIADLTFFESRLDQMLGRDYNRAGKLDDGEEAPAPVKTVRGPKVSVKASKIEEFISSIEAKIDELHNNNYVSDWELYDYMKEHELTPAMAKQVFDFYDKQLTEIEHAYNKTNKDIVEGYAGYKPKQLEALYDFYVMIVDDAERYQQVEKKERKPRTPKPVTLEKKMANFKCMAVDPVNNLKSIDSNKIVGSGELWAFNTKYNQLTVFRMADDKGLDVYRTAITSFDTATSVTKKLKAKDVAVILNQVLTGGKIQLRKLMTEIKASDQKLQERMNENTILLRVVPK